MERRTPEGDKATALMRMFGVTADRIRQGNFELDCSIDIEPGDVVYITGPSGSGKSTILRELERMISPDERINLADIELPDDRACIDCIEGELMESIRLLVRADLSDVFNLLNQPAVLSEGQQWRFRLAVALSQNPKFIFADEFTSSLGRISALTVAYNIGRHASRTGTVFVLAGCHRDVLGELRPDIIIERDLTGNTTITYRDYQRQQAHTQHMTQISG